LIYDFCGVLVRLVDFILMDAGHCVPNGVFFFWLVMIVAMRLIVAVAFIQHLPGMPRGLLWEGAGFILRPGLIVLAGLLKCSR